MFRRLELFILNIIQGKCRGCGASLLWAILWLLSWGYRVTVFLRNKAYDFGIFQTYRPPIPVISVGNIVAGGTGKTPCVLHILEALGSDSHIALLSRGYRSRAENEPLPLLFSQGEGPLYSSERGGDEPYLISRRFPKAWIYVGRNRVESAKSAVEAGLNCLLLDDGMQYRALERDFEVLLLDARDPFGRGYFLPAGLLRESPSSLSRANLIIITNVKDRKIFEDLKAFLRKYTKAPVIGTALKPRPIKGKALSFLEGKSVGIFCGIARPESFRETVKEMGANILGDLIVPDHLLATENQLKDFSDICLEQGAECLLCTEKDQVKLSKNLSLSLPIYSVEVSLSIIFGTDIWDHFLGSVRERME